MYEEDRTRALELYSDIFDEVGNETAVLQLLVSPTRQAVNLARAYGTRERSLQADDGTTPAYLQVIDQLRKQAEELTPVFPKVNTDQISLFEVPEEPKLSFEEYDFPELEEPAETAEPMRLTEEIGFFPDEDKAEQSAPLSTPPAMAQEKAVVTPEQELDDFSDAVEAFLADFNISDDLLPREKPLEAQVTPARPKEMEAQFVLHEEAPVVKEEPVPAPEPAPEAEQNRQPETQRDPAPQAEDTVRERRSTAVDLSKLPDLPDLEEPGEKKPVVPLLILFIVLAIPVGLLCVGLILALAVPVLGGGVSLLWSGLFGFGSAFTAFSVFADILLVAGLSLAATAIGVLLLWLFVWLLIGAIPGVVRGLCALGRKLCYKEVSA